MANSSFGDQSGSSTNLSADSSSGLSISSSSGNSSLTPYPSPLELITSSDPSLRNRPFLESLRGRNAQDVLQLCAELEAFRHRTHSLYDQVRALLFLYAAHRYLLQEHPDILSHAASAPLPLQPYSELLDRRFEGAIAGLRATLAQSGPDGYLLSTLAEAYRRQAFQTLMDQVRSSVRQSRGNQWMFRLGHAGDHPLRIRSELRQRPDNGLFPILREVTPVRLDLSHSGWSDIFFLGMDYPEGANVLNISVDLAVHGRDPKALPPVEAWLRVIPEPLIRLTSLDLGATKDVADLADLFNFGNDYLSLLKAGIIASGIIPPAAEGTGQRLEDFLTILVGQGHGLELVTKVNDIPKGSRLAVSTNLLAGIISVLMRATGQTERLEGGLTDGERRLVVSRAILGEWQGGSGGGWQDSGGIWPGIKVIQGAPAREGDPEFGISRGRLLPNHRVLSGDAVHPELDRRLAQSLILFHGGMAQNVGPILEMVTENYLLRDAQGWLARKAMRSIFDGILEALRSGDMRQLGGLTQKNFDGPLKSIIPWVTNRFTETLIARCRQALGSDYYGFLMLGGMSGGGMGLFVAPERRQAFLGELGEILRTTKRELEAALPFAMDPVVYDFAINSRGTWSELLPSSQALMPGPYYSLHVPRLADQAPGNAPVLRRLEVERFTSGSRDPEGNYRLLRQLVNRLFPAGGNAGREDHGTWQKEVHEIEARFGFDGVLHERLRHDLRSGRIGLGVNRLPQDTEICDVAANDVQAPFDKREVSRGTDSLSSAEQALREGRVAVLTLAGGVGSRWTQGAGVIKALSPFISIAGVHRDFLDIHLAKSRRIGRKYHVAVPHLLSTSFLTHEAIAAKIAAGTGDVPVLLSPGKSLGRRLVPMVRDLRFQWQETVQQKLDEQKQKRLDDIRQALMRWAESEGEGSDYRHNAPWQLFHPPGHWYEIPNLFKNGTLARLLREHPRVEHILLHNLDTLGADLDPACLARHLESGHTLTFEVIPRRFGDHGGGLARVNGQLRLLEGLAQPRESDDLGLRFYNTMSTWIRIDGLLETFGLTREDILGADMEAASSDAPGPLQEKTHRAIRRMAARLPTYVTLKDVKLRWGHGQEDIYPVAQFEKLWSDMSALPEISCGYLAVSRARGQQLKDPAELDAWNRDGSREYVEGLCDFDI